MSRVDSRSTHSGSQGSEPGPESRVWSAHERNSFQAFGAQVRSALNRDQLFVPHATFILEQLGKLGEGGMGVVYRVRDRRLGREAALKLLNNEQVSHARRQRFLREARITARLDHPFIPPVYEAGKTEQDQLFMLMKLIEGETLKERIKRYHKRPTEEALRELLQAIAKVGEALAYSHSQGIIHRDVKPSNIMLGRFGEVFLVDWGLARDLAESESLERIDQMLSMHDDADDSAAVGLTQDGAVIGTLGYMPPEQAVGEPAEQRSDVFALGACLAEALTGERVFGGTTPTEIMAATVGGRPRRPRSVKRSIPAELEWIALDALEPDLKHRTKSAGLFVKRLEAFLADRPIEGYRYGLTGRLRRAVRRRPGLSIGLVLGTLLISGLALLWSELVRSKQAWQKAEGVLTLLSEARVTARRGGKISDVRERLEKALDLGGRKKPQLMEAARIYAESNDKEAATACLEEVVKRFPPAFDALFELHKLEIGPTEGFRWTKPLSRLLKLARKENIENELTFYSAGIKAFKAEQFSEAKTLFDKAIAKNRLFAAAFSIRGMVSERLGEFDAAVTDYSKAIELDPGAATPYFNRGVAYFKANKLEAAHADFSEAILRNPRHAGSFASRGATRYALRDTYGAKADYLKAIELKPKLSRPYLSLGNLYFDQNKLKEAERQYTKAIVRNPKYREAYATRAEARSALKDHQGALDDLAKAAKLSPLTHREHAIRGAIRSNLNDFKGAFEDYSQAIKGDSTKARYWFNRGNVLYRLKRKQEAVEDYSEALKRDRSIHDALLYRGLCFIGLGNRIRAIEDLEAFVALEPKHSLTPQLRRRIAQLRNE